MNRLLLAVLLLAVAFPAAAITVKMTALVWMAAHTSVTVTAVAVLLLLRTAAAGRLLAPLVGARVARVLTGGAR